MKPRIQRIKEDLSLNRNKAKIVNIYLDNFTEYDIDSFLSQYGYENIDAFLTEAEFVDMCHCGVAYNGNTLDQKTYDLILKLEDFAEFLEQKYEMIIDEIDIIEGEAIEDELELQKNKERSIKMKENINNRRIKRNERKDKYLQKCNQESEKELKKENTNNLKAEGDMKVNLTKPVKTGLIIASILLASYGLYKILK